jgi:hypothetical protein
LLLIRQFAFHDYCKWSFYFVLKNNKRNNNKASVSWRTLISLTLFERMDRYGEQPTHSHKSPFPPPPHDSEFGSASLSEDEDEGIAGYESQSLPISIPLPRREKTASGATPPSYSFDSSLLHHRHSPPNPADEEMMVIVNTRARDGSVVILKDGESFIAPSSPRSAGDDSPRSIVVVTSSQHSPRDEQGGDENDTLIGGGDDEASGHEAEEDYDAGGRVEELMLEEIDERLEKGEDSTKVHSVFGLVALVFFLVCGGAYGTEDLGGSIPPLYALTGILIIPWVRPDPALPARLSNNS